MEEKRNLAVHVGEVEKVEKGNRKRMYFRISFFSDVKAKLFPSFQDSKYDMIILTIHSSIDLDNRGMLVAGEF